MGSDDPPPPPLCVENVKIRENSEKSGDLRGSLRDPLQPFLGPLKNIRTIVKFAEKESENLT